MTILTIITFLSVSLSLFLCLSLSLSVSVSLSPSLPPSLFSLFSLSLPHAAFEDYPPGFESKVAPPLGNPSPCIRLKNMFEHVRSVV